MIEADRIREIEPPEEEPLPTAIVQRRLEVYFPREGRTVEVDKARQVTVNKGIADAVFYAPDFFAVRAYVPGGPQRSPLAPRPILDRAISQRIHSRTVLVESYWVLGRVQVSSRISAERLG